MDSLATDNYISRLHQLRNLICRKLVYSGFRLNYHGICDWYLLSLFVIPSYFGVRLAFFDMTAFRFFEILLLVCIWKDKEKRTQFITMVKKCPYTAFIGLYMVVVVYTNLYHPSLNTIFYWFMNGVFVFYLVSYLIITEYGVNGFIKKLRCYIYILTLISPMELIIGKSPFMFLDTLGKVGGAASRFGYARIMGNWWEANGYALYLCILLPFLCWNYKENKIDLLGNKWIILLTLINIFLTGSRLNVATSLCILAICFFVQKKRDIKRSAMVLAVAIPVCIVVILALQNLSPVRSLLCTFFSAFDEIFNTNIAVKFGADASVLQSSSHYRELLFKYTFFGDWLNPLIGKGGGYKLSLYVEKYSIQSCDNFYVGQYVTYAWPGVIVWLIMSVSFLISAIKNWINRKNPVMLLSTVSIIFYFLSLWYLDQLQTFPIMFTVFALIFASEVKQTKFQLLCKSKIE